MKAKLLVKGVHVVIPINILVYTKITTTNNFLYIYTNECGNALETKWLVVRNLIVKGHFPCFILCYLKAAINELCICW